MKNKKYSIKKIISKMAALAFGAAVLIGVTACKSVPKEIPEDLDARQLIQLGQDNYDAGQYKAAEAYFNEVLKRYGNDAKHYVEATYEIGHLNLKLKKYEKAYNCFNELLGLFEVYPVGLPGKYKKLCQIELDKIPQKVKDDIVAKKAAKEADLAAEAEKVKAEETARKAKEESASKSTSESESYEIVEDSVSSSDSDTSTDYEIVEDE